MFKHIAFQQKEGFCGVASLKVVLHHFGINLTEKKIAKMSGATPSKGVELEALLRLSKKLGIKGFVKHNADIKDIKKAIKNKRAVIVEWFFEDDGHITTVSNIDGENIYLQDPHLGHLRAIRLDIFKRIWFTFPGNYMKTKQELILRPMLILYK